MSKKLTLLATALAIGSAEKDMFCAQRARKSNHPERPLSDRMKNKGQLQFIYEDGTVIYALNKKNADRKYNKLKQGENSKQDI